MEEAVMRLPREAFTKLLAMGVTASLPEVTDSRRNGEPPSRFGVEFHLNGNAGKWEKITEIAALMELSGCLRLERPYHDSANASIRCEMLVNENCVYAGESIDALFRRERELLLERLKTGGFKVQKRIVPSPDGGKPAEEFVVEGITGTHSDLIARLFAAFPDNVRQENAEEARI